MDQESDPIARAVVAALATELKVSEATVRSAKSLKADLRMDSIAVVNVAFAIEDEFGIEIDLEQPAKFDSLEGILGVVRALVDGRSSGM